MKQEKIEFFSWIKKIEFKSWKNYYINYFREINNDQDIIDWINNNLNSEKNLSNKIKIFESENKNLIKKINKEENKKNLTKDEEKKINKYEVMISINENLNFISKDNYSKIKKHKIIYFMIAFAIYKNKLYFAWDKYNDIFKIFFIDQKRQEMEWCAFENGPILKNIYKWNDDDKEIYFNNLTSDQLKTLETAYFLLKNYSTPILINESHKTDPWKKVFEKGSYYREIKNKNIIEYFKENKPFFVSN